MKAVEVLFVTVLRAVDGDSISVDVNNCNVDFFCKKVEIRLAGIDTSEMHSTCPLGKERALKAKALVDAAYPPGSTAILSNPKHDKYGRILADLPAMSDKLLKEGLAVPYNGEKKTHDWCK